VGHKNTGGNFIRGSFHSRIILPPEIAILDYSIAVRAGDHRLSCGNGNFKIIQHKVWK